MIAREILLRRTPLRRGGWLFFLVCSVCLAISACYEFFEWWAAVIGGAAATEFLGTQGDSGTRSGTCSWPWSARSPRSLRLSRLHDRQLRLADSLTAVTRGRTIR